MKNKCECQSSLCDVNEVLNKFCSNNYNALEPCKSDDPCALQSNDCSCNTGSPHNKAVVDLIVLIDTSGSMKSKASAISAAADKAIKMAQKNCPTDLRVEWLGVGGTFPGTKFDQTYRDYIINNVNPNPSFSSDAVDIKPHGSREEGANACADLANYFGARQGACQAIFYISDEALDQGNPQDAADDTATQDAIAACNANNVSVFAHLASGMGADSNVNTIKNYQDLTTQTGGKAVIGGSGSEKQYLKLLEEVICSACGDCCKTIGPCISITWGDSKCDTLETDDLEKMCITVCNCYSNITFKDLTICSIKILDANGNAVERLPDGSLSVDAIPFGPFCFGDIPPCEKGKASCISREFAISTRGAKAGGYQLILEGVCYSIVECICADACFNFELCKS
ncbi:MAG: hypothetical protein DSZ29_05615 [Aquificaceae bacterium]|nr:MAG: hypothetical protein DSZ29_05615 [Aquificaceae bacterium]